MPRKGTGCFLKESFETAASGESVIIMIKTRRFTLHDTIIITALLLLAVIRAEAMGIDRIDNRIAELLEISRNVALYRTSGEQWVNETRKTIHNLTSEIGVSEMIKVGTPIYHQIMGLTEPGDFNIFPELIAGELAKVTEYGGAELDFDDKSDRYAKRMLQKAASYLPAKVVRRIPTLVALNVIGRGWFYKNTPDKAVIKTNGVRISLHELGHAIEYSDDHLLIMRKEFYDNRTRGNEIRKLNRGLFSIGYRPNESYRSGFVYRYMGKEGGVEVFSCGIEYVFFNYRDIWHRDPEVTKFVLGSLIFYGSDI